MQDSPDHFTQPAWNRERAQQWKRFGPPARPSAGEIAAYEQQLRADVQTIAVLGSTPELRSLARRRTLRCVCIDINGEVFRALSELVEPAGSDELLEANWLDLAQVGTFDAIVGDGAINMLPPDCHARFLERVAAALRPGGRALLRVHVVGPICHASPQEVVTAYRRHPDPGSFWSWTRTHFDMLWRDADDAIHFADCQRRVRQLWRDGVLQPDEYATYDALSSVNNITLYYVQPDAFARLAARWFDIESITHAADYEAAQHHPLYVLVKRP